MMSPPVPTGPQFFEASDRTLLIDWGGSILLETHHRVARLLRWFEEHPQHGIVNLHPAYCSLLVVFDPLRLDHGTLQRQARDAIANLESISLPRARTVEIPVNYGGEAGPDLADVATL